MSREHILAKYKWRKVEAPKPWRPGVGDEVVGYYLSTSQRNGEHGRFTAVYVAVPGDGVRYITGVRIVDLIAASMVARGEPVRIIFDGLETTGSGRQMKTFSLYVSYAERADETDLPQVREY